MKLLIVEDEKDLLESVCTYFRQEGFVCEGASSFFEAEDKLAAYEYDVVILDISLPDGSGLDLLKLIKVKALNTGVLIVSAKNSLDDKLAGLDTGADDYITKPFHLAELNSRVNAVIRRRNFKGHSRVSFNEVEIDPGARQISVSGRDLSLTRKEFDLLLFFVMNKNRVVTHEAIAGHLWGDHIDSLDNFDFLYTHIKNLRRKIESAGGKDYLKTVYGSGYKYSDQ